MPALSVAALVISHRQPTYLRQTLAGLLSQTAKPSQIMVVETAGDPESLGIARELNISVITPGDLRLGAAIEAGRAALRETPGWLWILHDDSSPEPEALERMSRAAETSPSVAVIGPKLLRWDDPIRIQQLGLTVTRSGRPFLLVQDEYDQGQYDADGDVLAVSTAGMLISNGLWQELGGIQDKSPVFAQDLELGLLARAKGYRVVVESSARVLHAGLSMSGARPRGWVGGSRLEGLARAHLHLATAIWPLPLVVLLYLFLPLIVLALIPVNLLAKRPKRIFSQIMGWFWAWGTIPTRFEARGRLQAAGSLKGARTLFAKPQQIRRRKLSELVEEPEADTPSFTGLFGSNQAWFALAPLLASFSLWPSGALYAQRLVPLSETFSEVFQSVGASFIQRGAGLVAPADPYNWFLALLAAVSPLGPSFGLAAFLFIAPALSFFTSWKLAGLFVPKPWARTLVALGYSLSPLVLGAAHRGEVVELTAMVFAPLAGFLIAKALMAFNSARSWRWTGLAGLALAVVAVSAPVLAGFITLITLAAAVVFRRRALIAIWVPLPSVVLLWPWASHWLQSNQPALLSSTSWAAVEPFKLLEPQLGYFLVAILLLAVIALFISQPWKLGLLTSVAAVALLLSWYQPVSSASPLLGLAVLALLIAFASGFEVFPKPIKLITSLLVLVALALQASFIVFFNPVTVSYGQQRQLPALIVAQSSVDSEVVKTLHVRATDSGAEAELVWGDGLALEERGLASRYQLAPLETEPVAKLAAALIAGNPQGVESLIDELGVRFILLSSSDPNLLSSLEVGIGSMEFLQPAGKSEFGLLWQTAAISTDSGQGSSADRRLDLQLLALAGFALLALPTPAAIRGSRRAQRGER